MTKRFEIGDGRIGPDAVILQNVSVQKKHRGSVADLAKTAFDRVVAALALVFFAPFFVAIGTLILLTDGRPIFFGHTRIGRDGRTFKCLKFRTMVRDADAQLAYLLATDPAAKREWDETQKLRNDPRINCLGEFFRKTSLDELPQLWNVLKGDMSIVGPRPIVASEVHHYGPSFQVYTTVRPGITGLWQVSGRSDTSYPQRVSMDVEYVAKRSFLLDLKIMLKTFLVVLKKDGAR